MVVLTYEQRYGLLTSREEGGSECGCDSGSSVPTTVRTTTSLGRGTLHLSTMEGLDGWDTRTGVDINRKTPDRQGGEGVEGGVGVPVVQVLVSPEPSPGAVGL